MRRNSVLDGLRVRQFDDIQDEINEMVDCRSEMTEGKFLGVNETKSSVSSELVLLKPVFFSKNR